MTAQQIVHVLMETAVLYYVARKRDLKSILKTGIKPSIPDDFEDEKAVYLFPDRTSMEDAVVNWLGDRYEEDEALVVLHINPTGLSLSPSTVDWEVKHLAVIPPQNILKYEDL